MMAPKEPVMRRLKIAKGQLEGIMRMVEEDRYCIDISTQLMAVIAALKGVNREVLKAHLEHCVKSSMEANDPSDIEEKIEEVISVINKLTR